MKISLLLLVILLGAACSKQPTTSAKLEVTLGAVGITTLTGGFVITGKSSKGEQFIEVMTADTTLTRDLNNGQWSFLAIYWDGASAFDGKPRCAAQDTSLSGGEQSITLNLTNANCFSGLIGNAHFGSGSPGNYQFKHIFPVACRKSVGALSSSDGCDLTFDNSTTEANVGFMQSFKVLLGSSHSSGCFETNGTPTGFPRIPVLHSRFASPFAIKAYPTATCVDAAGSVVIQIDSSKAKVQNTGGSINVAHLQITEADVCALADSSPPSTAISYGRGDVTSPHLICNYAQLKHLHANFNTNSPTLRSRAYVLGRDLDLMEGLKAGNTGTPFSSCSAFKDGNTFMPLGRAYTTCPALNSQAFTGKFHGLGHTIKNFRFRDENVSEVGFFSTVDTVGLVAHLKLDNFAIEGSTSVGGVIASLGSGGVAHNLSATNGEVRGGNNVGGVIGSNTATVSHLKADKVFVRGQAAVGGVIGQTFGNISHAYFSGRVIGDHGISSMVGGVAGESDGSRVHTHLASSGYVSGSNHVGGVIGAKTNTGIATLTKVRSTAIVESTDNSPSARNAGGLVGYVSTGSISIADSFFAGNISFNCDGVTGGNPMCKIGGIVGAGTVTTNTLTTSSKAFGVTYGGTDGVVANKGNTAITQAEICSALPCDWQFASFDIPRLASETGTCVDPTNRLSVIVQADAPYARGQSAANPIIICSTQQLPNIAGKSSLHYRLGSDVTVPYASAYLANTLSGSLNGDGRVLGGGVWTSGATPIFATISANASVQNIFLSGFNFRNSSTTNVALLAAGNEGTITRVNVEGLVLWGSTDLAGLVLENNPDGLPTDSSGPAGTIIDSSVGGSIKGDFDIGGIAVTNSGIIKRTISQVNMGVYTSSPASDLDIFGGIAAVNESPGLIIQSMFKGRLDLVDGITWSSFNPNRVAGLVAVSVGGSLQDSHVDRSAEIKIPAGSQYIGGLVGEDSGSSTFTRLLFAGRLLHNDVSPVLSSALIGQSGASTMTSLFHESPILIASTSGFGSSQVFVPFDADHCDIQIPGGGPGAAAATYIDSFGWSNNVWAAGATTVTILHDPLLGSLCTGSSNTVDLWEYAGAFSNITNYLTDLNTPLALRNLNIQDAANAYYVYEAYKKVIQGQAITNMPVWIYEEGEASLFFPYND